MVQFFMKKEIKMIKNIMSKKYKAFHNIDGYWLRVPIKDFKLCGLEKSISSKSYMSDKYIFLYDNEDISKFFEANNISPEEKKIFNSNNVELIDKSNETYVTKHYDNYNWRLLK